MKKWTEKCDHNYYYVVEARDYHGYVREYVPYESSLNLEKLIDGYTLFIKPSGAKFTSTISDELISSCHVKYSKESNPEYLLLEGYRPAIRIRRVYDSINRTCIGIYGYE